MYHGSLIGFFNPISPVDVLWLCQYNQDKSWWCVCFFSSSVDLSMPSGWSACAHHTGIRSPPRGHWQPVCWAFIAHSVGNECPNIGLIFGQYSLTFRALVWVFTSVSDIVYDTFMRLLWYFSSPFYRSLILCKCLYIINIRFWYLRKMRLWYFFRRKYLRAYLKVG